MPKSAGRDRGLRLSRTQCRAARALLEWSQVELARRAGVATKTIADFERRETEPYIRTLAKIADTLEAAGIELLNGDAPGVRLRNIDHGSGF